jgi:hypothetical protein
MPDKVYKLFFHPGEVTEIRALGLRGKGPWKGFAGGPGGIVSGYFDDPEKFKAAALAVDKAGAKGVYFTVNPCQKMIMARAANRLIAFPERTTADAEIECLRWLLVDLDPVRPAGISSSEKELKAAYKMAETVAKWLEEELGFPMGIRACSGNGYHLCYRLPDLTNTPEHVKIIRTAISAIAHKFSPNGNSKKVDIDLTVFNPARIWKVYGTVARKGDSVPDRPHRKSELFDNHLKLLESVLICHQLKNPPSKN